MGRAWPSPVKASSKVVVVFLFESLDAFEVADENNCLIGGLFKFLAFSFLASASACTNWFLRLILDKPFLRFSAGSLGSTSSSTGRFFGLGTNQLELGISPRSEKIPPDLFTACWSSVFTSISSISSLVESCTSTSPGIPPSSRSSGLFDSSS